MKDFQKWLKDFKIIPEVQNVITLLRKEVANRHHDKYLADDLEEWVLKACYNATKFTKNFDDSEREKKKRAFQEIRAKGRNPLRATEDLQSFFKVKAHKDIVDYVATITTLHLENRDITIGMEKGMNIRTTIMEVLNGIEAGLKRYNISKGLWHWYHAGCLGFPKPIEQERKHIATDSLIFELAFHIRNYLSPGSPKILEVGLSMPTNCRWNKLRRVIADLVNAALNASFDESKIKERLDALKKEGVVLLPWEIDKSNLSHPDILIKAI